MQGPMDQIRMFVFAQLLLKYCTLSLQKSDSTWHMVLLPVGCASHEGVAAVRHDAQQTGCDRATAELSAYIALLLPCFYSWLGGAVQDFQSPQNFAMVAFHRLLAKVSLGCNAE